MMRSFTLRVGIGIAGALLAGLVALPATASAATMSPMSSTSTLPGVGVSRDELGQVVSVLPVEHHAGSCAELAGSSVTLTRPDNNGNATLVWNATVYSAHPQPAWHDTWHQSFTFRTARGTFIVSVSGGLDSPDLNNAWEQKTFQRVKANVQVAPDFYPLIGSVDWTGEC
jgi:hypothetical protein